MMLKEIIFFVNWMFESAAEGGGVGSLLES
jgi:hypothetical protein